MRGQAYLRAGDGEKAIAEFQNILAHRSVDPISELYALAYLGLARGYHLSGDSAKSLATYEQFR